MRIAFLTHEPFYPPSGGGSAEAVYLVRELVARGHGVHVFCPALLEPGATQRAFGIQLHEFKTWEMSRYTRLRNLKYVLYPFFLERMVRRAAAARSFDVVFSQHAISAVAAGRLKRGFHATVITNFLDHLTGFMEAWPRYVMPRPVLRRLMSFEMSIPRRHGVDGVLTVSDTLADLFAGTGFPKERIRPLYYGYDAGLFPFRGETTAPADGSPVVAMHGSFDQHHLGPIAERTIQRVSAERPGVRFRFIGRKTATIRGFLERVKQSAPTAQIECTGFIPYDQVAAHLAAATVGLVPYEESTGAHCAFVAKIVEYLAVGLPVASTRLRSASEYFRDTPTVRFADFTGESLAREVIHWVDASPALHVAAARTASERVRRELDWRVLARKAVDFVEMIHHWNVAKV